MVSVKMADKNMFDPLKVDPEPAELELGPFSTVNQEQALICIKQMSAWITV
jgi:hypothetical protein